MAYNSNVFSEILKELRRRKHAKRRKDNFEAIEALGFRLKQANELGQSQRYILKDAKGRIYDNDGAGYLSSTAAREAAEMLAENSDKIA